MNFGVLGPIHLDRDGHGTYLFKWFHKTINKPVIVFKYFLIVVVALLPAKAWALDVGLTPSHVFSLWTNINQSVLTVGSLTDEDGGVLADLHAMKSEGFAGKTPRDVLVAALAFESEFDKMRVRSGLVPTRQLDVAHKNTTPSDVFLVASRVLSSVVEWIIKNTDSDHLVSQYFPGHSFKDKTPSDVFGLVDLAQRRIDLILENFNKKHSG